jgi:hypothetical protein
LGKKYNLERMVIAFVVYHIWRQRNNYRFCKIQMTKEKIVKSILNEIKCRVGANVPRKVTGADGEVCYRLGVKTG